jgi:C4-dicarboxylate transporter DctM subunit
MMIRATTKIWGVLVLIILVLGGIYAVSLTPTEAGAMGAIGAFLMATFKRVINLETIHYSLRET